MLYKDDLHDNVLVIKNNYSPKNETLKENVVFFLSLSDSGIYFNKLILIYFYHGEI